MTTYIKQISSILNNRLNAQKAAFSEEPAPSLHARIDKLDRLKKAVVKYKDLLIKAVDADFGGRSAAETQIAEIIPVLEGIHYNKSNVQKWMKPSKRKTGMALLGASAKVEFQPLGVVGIVVPWNFPIFLGLSPLIGAFTAGNRAMIKTSEFAPKTGELVKKMLSEYFTEDEVSVFTGGVEVASEFTKLPFDHLVFTGSTQVGSIVMKAASENLTPVTLELGGKSPAIIHDSFPIAEAANRIAFGKGINAGQVCVSPDYIMVPKDKVNSFVAEFTKVMSKQYPTLKNNSDYTSIINQRQFDRLQSVINDAKQKGAQITEVNPANESFEGTRKIPMTVITNVNEDMTVMQEEIFGPLIPVVPYDNIEDAIKYVKARPRPLALYYFDFNTSRAKYITSVTHSGGVCINDTMNHVTVDDMPFGGVGPSGMGHYHGKEGFLNFSKAKGIVHKGKFNVTDYIAAPWGNKMYNLYMKFQYWRLG